MFLYHGTSTCRLPRLLKEGVLPRGKGRPGNWKGRIKSERGFVYLSRCFAAYYAGFAQTKDKVQDPSAEAVLLRIQIDEADLFPDEDFLAQVLAQQNGGSCRDYCGTVSIRHNKHLWESSLRLLGSVATFSIPSNQIVAYYVIPDLLQWSWLGGDTSQSIIAARILADEYQNRLDLLFECGLDAVWDKLQKSPWIS